jgi:hypothetical protein
VPPPYKKETDPRPAFHRGAERFPGIHPYIAVEAELQLREPEVETGALFPALVQNRAEVSADPKSPEPSTRGNFGE